MKTLRAYSMVIVLVVIAVLFHLLTNGLIFTAMNLTNIILQNSYVVLLILGMLPVILTGNVDLSVGSVLAFVGAIAAILQVNYHCGVLVTLLVSLLVLVPALEARQGMTYSLAYSIYRLCVPQLGFFTGGILLCALASVWLPVRVAGKGRRWLLAAGILSALPPLVLAVTALFAQSAGSIPRPVIRLYYPAVVQPLGRFLIQQLAPFAAAVCGFLGWKR